jgi:hypothetical protein
MTIQNATTSNLFQENTDALLLAGCGKNASDKDRMNPMPTAGNISDAGSIGQLLATFLMLDQ